MTWRLLAYVRAVPISETHDCRVHAFGGFMGIQDDPPQRRR